MASRWKLFLHKTEEELETELAATDAQIRKLREKGLLQSAGVSGTTIGKIHLQLKELRDEYAAILEALHQKNPTKYPESPYNPSVTHVVFGE